MGNGVAGGYVNTYAEIANNWIAGSLTPDNTWHVTGNVIGIGAIDQTFESLNFHVHFVGAVNSPLDFIASNYSESLARAYGDHASLSAQTAAGAWGFATGESTVVNPADVNGDGNVDGGDLQFWEDINPLGGISDAEYAIWLANAAPKVSNVIVSSTVSNAYGTNPPYEFADVVGSEEQLRTVPVGGANRIAIQFTKDVNISSADLDLIALNQLVTEPSVTSFVAPDASNDFTATWTFASVLPSAQYLIRLADSIQDLSGNALDGEWTNPGSITSSVTTSEFPSGDNYAGGDFEFVFTYLVGDANRDLAVTFDDYQTQSANYNQNNKTWQQGEFSGEGTVNFDDYQSLLANYNRDLAMLSIFGDYDNDFDLDNDDETDFLSFYNSQDDAADLNGDSSVDQEDYDAFYEMFGFGIELDVVI